MRGKHLVLRMMSKNVPLICSKGNEFIWQLFTDFFLLTSFQTIQKQG
ncbi:MAG: hypothetical protein QOF74_8709 [Caballeronia mineralivorans]|jgi:hypothetical protein|nr:hypothetical protein [Caballeronia mineralivorans]